MFVLWYETFCNTTLVKEEGGQSQARPHTWCEKVPKKICGPDNCQMIPGKSWPFPVFQSDLGQLVIVNYQLH